MTLHTDLIYRSQTRDVWHLFREAKRAYSGAAYGHCQIRHKRHRSSVEEFMSISGAEPEYAELQVIDCAAWLSASLATAADHADPGQAGTQNDHGCPHRHSGRRTHIGDADVDLAGARDNRRQWIVDRVGLMEGELACVVVVLCLLTIAMSSLRFTKGFACTLE